MGRLIATVMLLLALVGCAPAPATAPDMPTVSQTAMTQDEQFDYAFKQQIQSDLGYAPDQALIDASRELGKTACQALDDGATADQIVAALHASAPEGQREPLYIAVGVGIAVYCPWNTEKF